MEQTLSKPKILNTRQIEAALGVQRGHTTSDLVEKVRNTFIDPILLIVFYHQKRFL